MERGMTFMDRVKVINSQAIFALTAIVLCASLTACGMTKEERMNLDDLRATIGRKASIFVVTKDIPAGKALGADDLEIREIEAFMVPYNACSPDYKLKKEEQPVLGSVTARFLGEGGVLQPGDFYPKDKKVGSSDKKTDTAEKKSSK